MPSDEHSSVHGQSERTPLRWAVISWLTSFGVLLVKLGAWWVTQSAVLLADAAESGLDLATASMLVFAVRLSSHPADDGHPFGHGKAEYFSAGFQGGLIFITGALLIVQSAQTIGRAPQPTELGLGLALSIVATLANLALAIALIRAGRRLRSPALSSDGRHNLADVWTTVGGWLGLGLAYLTGYWILDPIVAIVVALHIIWTGVQVSREAVRGLMDASLPPAEVSEIESIVRQHMGEALEFHDLRTRRASEQAFVEFHLVVDGNTSVRESHALCDKIEHAIEAHLQSAHITIHVEPEHEQHGAPGQE